jgi:hypothetical protein
MKIENALATSFMACVVVGWLSWAILGRTDVCLFLLTVGIMHIPTLFFYNVVRMVRCKIEVFPKI